MISPCKYISFSLLRNILPRAPDLSVRVKSGTHSDSCGDVGISIPFHFLLTLVYAFVTIPM